MDSLTQLTLGAAVGEAIAGKKLGNKALLWGALAGTIPDLDVVTNFWMNDIEAMAFHRGITHSIFFTIVAPIFFASLARWFYKTNIHRSSHYNRCWRFFWIILGAILFLGSCYLLYSGISIISANTALLFGGLGIYWIYRSLKKNEERFENLSIIRWYFFFLMCFATHIAIDAFTTYGTQILQPFSNTRFTTSSISVVDPLYTLPLLICLLIGFTYARKNKLRRLWNWIGLGLSSLYMMFTFVNKMHVQQKFEQRLQQLNIPTSHCLTNPTIFNNILWHGIAETDTAYIEAYYSLFDKKDAFQDLRIVPKNRHLIKTTNCEQSETIDTLRWFSDDFYNYSEVGNSVYYNDLRFGSIWMDDLSKPDKQVFYFRLDDSCDAHEIRETNNISEYLEVFYNRLRGE